VVFSDAVSERDDEGVRSWALGVWRLTKDVDILDETNDGRQGAFKRSPLGAALMSMEATRPGFVHIE
jgi:hypothetical protein